MNISTSIKTIAPALLKAQKEMGSAVKDSMNPYFHSKYADLGSIMEACKGPLNDNGITILQPVGHDEHGDYVLTMLLHESGEFIEDKMRLVQTTDVQKQGSAISYARRYSLQSLVFIPSVDDDGETVVKHIEEGSTGTTVTKTGTVLSCTDCVKENKPSSIPENVYKYSLDNYGISLCYVHQQKHTKK